MAPDQLTVIAGIPIPSTSPAFLVVIGVHVLVGLACVTTGAVAMLSRKSRGRHSTFGTVYFWGLAAVFASATGLAIVRWAEDYPLFILGAVSFASAWLGRTVQRRRWPVRLHIAGMGASYVLLLTAFYVDNGKNLLLWRALPQIAFWLLPSAIGLPIIVYALLRHPLVRAGSAGARSSAPRGQA
jgi:uncharacterized membrane protein